MKYTYIVIHTLWNGSSISALYKPRILTRLDLARTLSLVLILCVDELLSRRHMICLQAGSSRPFIPESCGTASAVESSPNLMSRTYSTMAYRGMRHFLSIENLVDWLNLVSTLDSILNEISRLWPCASREFSHSKTWPVVLM